MNNLLNYGITGFSVYQGSDITLATHISHAILGAVTKDKVYLKTPMGYLSPDGMFMCVGLSGCGKTIPLRKAIDISRHLKIQIPSVFTPESIAEWFFQMDDGKYIHPCNGIIFWDEASAIFSDTQSKQYMSGILEIMSALHNHYIQPSYYKTSNYGVPQDPYVSLLANMVPQYLPNIPDYFWNQGLAGRILWRYIPPEPPRREGSWCDFEHYDASEKFLLEFRNGIGNIKEEIEKTGQPIPVILSREADSIVNDFRYNIETEWYETYQSEPWNNNYSYKKRLTELLGKTALRIAIGRHYMENKKISGLREITESDVILAKTIVEQSNKDLQTCFDFMNKKPKNHEDMLLTSKVNAVWRCIKEGYSDREIRQKTHTYASKATVDECYAILRRTSRVEVIGKNSDGKPKYQVVL